jgi:hypothetical protein
MSISEFFLQRPLFGARPPHSFEGLSLKPASVFALLRRLEYQIAEDDAQDFLTKEVRRDVPPC